MAGDRISRLVGRLSAGDRRALARLLTVVEDGDARELREVVERLHPRTGRAHLVGVTGPPGVGKSTLTNELVAVLRSRDRTVGVIAVDPSSPFSGGALLGDRVRMQAHHDDPGVFIRSMAARGHLGGLAVATPQAALVLDAAGFDVVIIETVGVGQAEVEVADTADTTVVVLVPNLGDSVQAAKAGILEIADVFVVNKADHGGAGRLESQLRGMLEAGRVVAGGPHDEPGLGEDWEPVVTRTVAVRAEGIASLVDAIGEHRRRLAGSGRLAVVRRRRAAYVIREIALDRVRSRLLSLPGRGADDSLLAALAAEVADRSLDPYAAADRLAEKLGAGERDG